MYAIPQSIFATENSNSQRKNLQYQRKQENKQTQPALTLEMEPQQ